MHINNPKVLLKKCNNEFILIRDRKSFLKKENKMRKSLFILTITAVLMGLIYIPAIAAAPVSYVSTIQVTNLDTVNEGNIILSFYAQDGSLIASVDDTIGAGQSNTYNTLPSEVPSGFNGSVVISSSVPIASQSNLAGKNSLGSRTHWASYTAFSAGSSNAYLPLLMANNYGYNTMYYVQNTGSANVDVNITYSDSTTNSITGLKPGASKKIDQATESHTKTVFSAILNATGSEIAVVVVEYGNELFAYSGFGSGSTLPIMPIVNSNNYGYWSSILIQNTGTSDTTVTVSYVPSLAGTACTETQTIPAGASKIFAQYSFTVNPPSDVVLTTDCAFKQKFVGSASVTSNSASQPLVAVVNQLNSSDHKGAAYSAFGQSSGAESVILPIIHDRNYGYWTSWTIVNNGSSQLAAGSITCTVSGKDGGGNSVSTSFSNPTALNVNESWLEQNNNKIAAGFVGGAICQGPSGAKLISTVNQLGQGSSWTGIDSLLVYEGVNP